ncbi:hypothetical protein Tsubulata_019868 [Turnera subulata]|uniref:Uncharacterized protein n=1 Tax=Turnera subulata TaxID=218843 RepID=A0A9Q0GGI6_9ROSI|nr:hypothetical protein Tsubulata_019868 [Turnera subulata]
MAFSQSSILTLVKEIKKDMFMGKEDPYSSLIAPSAYDTACHRRSSLVAAAPSKPQQVRIAPPPPAQPQASSDAALACASISSQHRRCRPLRRPRLSLPPPRSIKVGLWVFGGMLGVDAVTAAILGLSVLPVSGLVPDFANDDNVKLKSCVACFWQNKFKNGVQILIKECKNESPPDKPWDPMFKNCLTWILNSQKGDGFWGEYDDGIGHGMPTVECLPATIACMIAIKKWNAGKNWSTKVWLLLKQMLRNFLEGYPTPVPAGSL